MKSDQRKPRRPTLPQEDDDKQLRDARQFQLSIARTAYNYVRTYPHLESVPLSANVPPAEAFSVEYSTIVAEVIAALSDNFLHATSALLRRELSADVPGGDIQKLVTAYTKLGKLSWKHPEEDAILLRTFAHDVAELMPRILGHLSNLPFDLEKVLLGLQAAVTEALAKGPTAFLDSTLFDLFGMASMRGGADYLAPRSVEDYQDLIVSLPTPLMLGIEPQKWMVGNDKPCEQDWFFGYLQVAGFNTTNLRGVTLREEPGDKTISLAALMAKMPIDNKIFQAELGVGSNLTLEQAASAQRLYVCDYAMLAAAQGSVVHSKQRYVAAPIALFYWNPSPPEGYPPTGYGGEPRQYGVLQPIAIQLAQKFDAESAPIFTPKDSAHANDRDGYKWKLAKLFVNESASIQHESVAHLGDCHLTIEPIILATHRQLAEVHPLFKLLFPHFRFTIPINDGAIHNLVIPGGVVATNVAPVMADTLGLIDRAHQAWRWDDNSPDRIFKLRGVLSPELVFPFRDDTVLLWQAIRTFVGAYLAVYYRDSDDGHDLLADSELQAWIAELVSPQHANIQGMDKLKRRDGKVYIDNFEYLADVVAQIIYIAGPLHASVNYAQYPLGSYAPSVAASVYGKPPGKGDTLSKAEQSLPWYLPLDVALYTISFEYLLSSVQFDKLGHYDESPRTPYFTDPAVHKALASFQAKLAEAEVSIRERNQTRPMPYPFQLPSLVPNSISI